MVQHIVRILFLLAVLAITVSFAFRQEVINTGQDYITLYILLPVVVALGLVVADIFWHRKRLQVLGGLFFGVLVGLAMGYMLSLIVDLTVSFLPTPQPASNPGPYREWVLAQERAEQLEQAPSGGGLPVPSSQPTSLSAQAPGAQSLYAVSQTPLAASAPAAIDVTEQSEDNPRRRLVELRQIQYSNLYLKYEEYVAFTKIIQMIKLLLGAASVFVCVTVVLQTKDDFRFVIPYVEFSRQTKGGRPLLLDTSVIIDGRIADIAETRIFESEVIVPRFVLAELQMIADSDDKLKRNRGRRGLDMLNRLQSSSKIDIRLTDTRAAGNDASDVDNKLVALAKQLDGRIVTNDYNLGKIAQLRGVDTVNINDLANALKPVVMPGESLSAKMIKPGEGAGQGVGYLPDGTMIVAEGGRDHLGKDVSLIVTSVLQTSAGRMIFGRLDADKSFSRRERSAPPAEPPQR